MNNLIIEKLEKKDLKEDVSIYDTNHNLKTNFQKLLSEYDKIYQNPDYHNIVAKLDGKIVGMATIVINHDIVEELHPFLTVWNLGCDFIALIAEKDNISAQKFYESLGYQKEIGFIQLIDKEIW